jgi:hypothetical protein
MCDLHGCKCAEQLTFQVIDASCDLGKGTCGTPVIVARSLNRKPKCLARRPHTSMDRGTWSLLPVRGSHVRAAGWATSGPADCREECGPGVMNDWRSWISCDVCVCVCGLGRRCYYCRHYFTQKLRLRFQVLLAASMKMTVSSDAAHGTSQKMVIFRLRLVNNFHEYLSSHRYVLV